MEAGGTTLFVALTVAAASGACWWGLAQRRQRSRQLAAERQSNHQSPLPTLDLRDTSGLASAERASPLRKTVELQHLLPGH